MANRYPVATGNWNSTSTWSSTLNGSAGASVPTASDDVFLAKNSSITVTLTADAECFSISGGNVSNSGVTLNLNGFALTTHASVNTAYATFNLTNSKLILDGGLNIPAVSSISTTNSTIIFNLSFAASLQTAFALNDVIINLGAGTASSTNFDVYGSPTLRSLIVRSKNNAAHIMNFNGDYVLLDKFVAIGSSSSNKLSLTTTNETVLTGFDETSSCYGQHLIVDIEGEKGHPSAKLYIGSNSTNTFGGDWLTQDPPKVSTLVDPLTTSPGSNSNWIVTGTVTQGSTGIAGGGYNINNGGDDGAGILSSDTYDLTGDGLIFEGIHNGPVYSSFGIDIFGIYGVLQASVSYPTFSIEAIAPNGTSNVTALTGTAPIHYFFKILYNGTAIEQHISSDGVSFSKIREDNIDEAYVRSVRLSTIVPEPRSIYIGSINMLPAPANNGSFLTFF